VCYAQTQREVRIVVLLCLCFEVAQELVFVLGWMSSVYRYQCVVDRRLRRMRVVDAKLQVSDRLVLVQCNMFSDGFVVVQERWDDPLDIHVRLPYQIVNQVGSNG
jgi:hypothetical protein